MNETGIVELVALSLAYGAEVAAVPFRLEQPLALWSRLSADQHDAYRELARAVIASIGRNPSDSGGVVPKRRTPSITLVRTNGKRTAP